jgi:hypothetical protein
LADWGTGRKGAVEARVVRRRKGMSTEGGKFNCILPN